MPFIYRRGSSGSTSEINSIRVDEYGHLIFVLADGTVTDAGPVLNADQINVLNTAVTFNDIGDGLGVDEDGKLIPVLSIVAGDETVSIVDGAFTMPMASTSQAGLVKLSDSFTLNALGQLDIDRLDINKLFIPDGDELVIGETGG